MKDQWMRSMPVQARHLSCVLSDGTDEDNVRSASLLVYSIRHREVIIDHTPLSDFLSRGCPLSSFHPFLTQGDSELRDACRYGRAFLRLGSLPRKLFLLGLEQEPFVKGFFSFSERA